MANYIALFVAGCAGGFFGSAVGSAGLVSLPVLLLMGLSPHAAIGTTRPAAIMLELMSALRYRREGKLNNALLKKALSLGVYGAAGSALGAVFIANVGDQTLRLLLSVVIASMAVFFFMHKEWGMYEHPHRQQKFVLLALSTFLMGIYAGLFGFTFGTLIMLVLVGFGFTLLQSAGMGRVIGTMTSISSAGIFAWHGYVEWNYAIVLGIGFGIGGWIGASVAAKAGNRYVKILLFIVVVTSVVKLLFDYVAAL